MILAIAESPASTFAAAAFTRSSGLIWATGRKPHADFRFGMARINPCALYQPREALDIKRHERRQNHLPSPGRKPLFADYVAAYFEKAKVQRKRPGTVENERQAIERWRDYLGHVRIDQIATPAITAYLDKRLKGGIFAAASCSLFRSEQRTST